MHCYDSRIKLLILFDIVIQMNQNFMHIHTTLVSYLSVNKLYKCEMHGDLFFLESWLGVAWPACIDIKSNTALHSCYNILLDRPNFIIIANAIIDMILM